MIKKLLFMLLFITPASNLFSMPTPEQIKKELDFFSALASHTVSKKDAIERLKQKMYKYMGMFFNLQPLGAKIAPKPEQDPITLLKTFRLMAIINLLEFNMSLLAEKTIEAVDRLMEFYVAQEHALDTFQAPGTTDLLKPEEIEQLNPSSWTPFMLVKGDL